MRNKITVEFTALEIEALFTMLAIHFDWMCDDELFPDDTTNHKRAYRRASHKIGRAIIKKREVA